jgi:hypothetical protein
MNVFYYLPNEVAAVEWKTNMHHVTLRNGCRLIDIYAKCLIPALHNLQQRLAHLAETDNDNGCLHNLKLTFLVLQACQDLIDLSGKTVFQLSATTGAQSSTATRFAVVSSITFVDSEPQKCAILLAICLVACSDISG